MLATRRISGARARHASRTTTDDDFSPSAREMPMKRERQHIAVTEGAALIANRISCAVHYGEKPEHAGAKHSIAYDDTKPQVKMPKRRLGRQPRAQPPPSEYARAHMTYTKITPFSQDEIASAVNNITNCRHALRLRQPESRMR